MAAEVRRARRKAKPNVRGELSREAILDAAERQFGEFGYRAVSTAVIANEAEISDPGLLHHFGSKEGLLMAVLNRRYCVDAEKLRGGERLSGKDLVGTLGTIVRENEGKRDQVKLTMVLLGESIPPSHPGHEYYQERYVRVREMLRQHVEELQRRGELADDVDSQALATVIIAVLDGLQLQWLLDPELDMSKAVASFLQIFSAVLRPPAKGETPISAAAPAHL